MDNQPHLMTPGSFDPSKYSGSLFLDRDEKFKLYWHHEWTDDSMHFAVEVETTGKC